MENFSAVESRMRSKHPDLTDDSADFKTLLIEEIAAAFDYSDTKIAKYTGYSRGFVIPRVRRLRPPKAQVAVEGPQISGRPAPTKAVLSKASPDSPVRVGSTLFL